LAFGEADPAVATAVGPCGSRVIRTAAPGAGEGAGEEEEERDAGDPLRDVGEELASAKMRCLAASYLACRSASGGVADWAGGGEDAWLDEADGRFRMRIVGWLRAAAAAATRGAEVALEDEEFATIWGIGALLFLCSEGRSCFR
jgi:hypothetical protein